MAVGLVLVIGLAAVSSVDPQRDDSSKVPAQSGASEPVTLPRAAPSLAEIAEIRDDFSRNAALYRLARGATREQVEAWLAEVETLPPTPHRYDVARVLYIRFAVLAPEAALEHVLAGAAKPAWLEAVLRTWAQLDPEAAIARAASLDSSAKSAASRALLQLGLPLDELRSVAERLDEPENLDWYRRIEAVHGVAPPTPTQRVLAEVEARGLAKRDGESHADAWNRVIGIEQTHVRQILAEQIALDWAVEDPHAALAALDLLAIDLRVATSGGPYGSQMHMGPLRMLIRDSIVWKWAREDPIATLEWILDREDRETGLLVQAPLGVLAGRDPDKAITLLATVPQTLRYHAAAAVLRVLASRNLDQALGLFATFDVADQSRHARTLGRHLAENRSAEEALDWAVSLDHRIRARNVLETIRVIHEADRTEALRLIASIDNPTMRLDAAQELVWPETRRDAREALAWALDFESANGRSTLVERVLDTWASDDPEAACGALFELRGGLLRDRAAVAMMFDVARHDIRLAERLFGAIETPAEQANAAKTLHWHFSNTDPNPRRAAHYRKYLPAGDGDTP